MESIFESLENLNVSEECFEDIVGLVEGMLMDFATGATYSKDRDTRGENAMKREQFANKHPNIYSGIRRIENAVSKPFNAIQRVGNKVAGKVADKVTNMDGKLGNALRGNKLVRKTVGKVALRNAQKGIDRAKGNWNAHVQDLANEYGGGRTDNWQQGVNDATKKAIDTEKKWGARIHY